MSEILDIHRPFAKWLDEQRVPYVNARSDRESTIAEGHPDFTLTYKGRVIFLELKTEKGKLSKAQEARIAYLESAGNKVYVARSFDTAKEFATEWIRQVDAQSIKTPGDPQNLYTFGGVVFRKVGFGQFERVRPVEPGDHVLQSMGNK